MGAALTPRQGVAVTLKALEKKGAIVNGHFSARGIRIVDDDVCPYCGRGGEHGPGMRVVHDGDGTGAAAGGPADDAWDLRTVLDDGGRTD